MTFGGGAKESKVDEIPNAHELLQKVKKNNLFNLNIQSCRMSCVLGFEFVKTAIHIVKLQPCLKYNHELMTSSAGCLC